MAQKDLHPADFDPYERVPDGDPRQCDAIAGSKKCSLIRYPNSQYCIAHGGIRDADKAAEEAKKIYLASQWQREIGIFSQDPQLKSLTREIGVLRLLLTKIIGNCQTENDLLLRSSTISEMVMKIDKLVGSCDRLDKSMGKMVNKQQLTEFGQVVIVLVAKYLPNPELLRVFADEMTEAIKMAGSSPERVSLLESRVG
jgi:hypothetical protein